MALERFNSARSALAETDILAGGRICRETEMVRPEWPLACQDKRAADHVLKLANVAGPRHSHQLLHTPRRQGFATRVVLVAECSQEVAHQNRYVSAPLTQRNHL